MTERRRSWWRALCWFLPLAVVAVVVLVSDRAPRDFYSDPSAVRPWAEHRYEAVIKADELRPRSVGSVSATISSHLPGQNYSMSYVGGTWYRYFRLQPRVVPATLEGGIATTNGFRLVAHGMTGALPRPARYYSPAGVPIEVGELSAWGSLEDPHAWTARTFPWFPHSQFYFEGPETDEWRVTSLSVFDARTRVEIGNPINRSEVAGNRFTFLTPVLRWHDGPLDVVLYLANGGLRDVTRDLVAGETISHADWTMTIDTVPDPVDENITTLGASLKLTGTTSTNLNPVTLEVITKKGEVAAGPFHLTWPLTTFETQFTFSGKDHYQLRARIYERSEILSFRLPGLYGFPAGAVEDQFNVRIPCVYVDGDAQFADMVARLVQLDWQEPRAALSTPPGYYPKTFRNVTPRELLEEYESYLPHDLRVDMDPERQIFFYERSLFRKANDRVEEWFSWFQ